MQPANGVYQSNRARLKVVHIFMTALKIENTFLSAGRKCVRHSQTRLLVKTSSVHGIKADVLSGLQYRREHTRILMYWEIATIFCILESFCVRGTGLEIIV